MIDIHEILTNRYDFLPKELEIQKGWIFIIYALCENIKDELEKQSLESFEISQVKQKHGELRIYRGFFDPDWDDGEEDNPIDDMIEDAIVLAQTTCEFCGKQAIRRIANNWIYVICNDCFNSILNEK